MLNSLKRDLIILKIKTLFKEISKGLKKSFIYFQQVIWFTYFYSILFSRKLFLLIIIKKIYWMQFFIYKFWFYFIYKKDVFNLLLLEKECFSTSLFTKVLQCNFYLRKVIFTNHLKNIFYNFIYKKKFNSIFFASKLIFITFIENKTFTILFTKLLKKKKFWI